MIYLRCLCENTAKISENKRKLGIKTVRSADFRSTVMAILPPAQESVPGNANRAGIRMNTAHPIRIQYS